MSNKMLNEITFPLPNVNDETFEVWNKSEHDRIIRSMMSLVSPMYVTDSVGGMGDPTSFDTHTSAIHLSFTPTLLTCLPANCSARPPSHPTDRQVSW